MEKSRMESERSVEVIAYSLGNQERGFRFYPSAKGSYWTVLVGE